jgi:RNAse (barnase) inhibitor barstar
MSGLAAILADHVDRGVYRWHAAFTPEEVGHAVERAGWRFAHVDGWRHQTRGEFLAAVGEALSFPDHYGQNLDALHDCLRDLPGPTVLLWDGWGALARDDGPGFAAVRSVLAEHTAVVTTLLRGDGPEVDVPSLD